MTTIVPLEKRQEPEPVQVADTAVERAAREHERLQSELQELVRQTCSVRHMQEPSRLHGEFRKLTSQVLQLQEDWQDHTKWVETEFLPYAAWYWGEEPELFAHIDHEYVLAHKMLDRFTEQLGRINGPLDPAEARRLTSYLLQAYAVLKNRMLEEEEIMQQLQDQSNRYDF